MLTRAHKILIGLLVVQLALVVLMLGRSSEPQPVKEVPLLAGLDAAKVTRVRLFASGAAKPGVDLVKKGNAWVVASHFDYPADAAKVKGLLEPLAKIAAGEPIATSATRHKQLRVADTDFDRKIVLTLEGGGEKTLLIGNPAGARRTAIRLGGDDVYAATDVSYFIAEPSGFVSTKYVDIPKADVERLTVRRDQQMIEIARAAAPTAPAGATAGSGSAGAGAGSGSAGAGSAAAPEGSGSAAAAPSWTVTIDGAPVKLAAGESLDTDAIERIVGQATSIDLRAPGDPKRDATKPTATVIIHRKGAEQPTSLDVIADGESYWVHQRELDRAIVVDKSTFADVVTIDRDKLVKKPPPPPAPAPGAGSGAGSAAKPPGPAGAATPPTSPTPRPATPAAPRPAKPPTPTPAPAPAPAPAR
jgi:hypothetical protein